MTKQLYGRARQLFATWLAQQSEPNSWETAQLGIQDIAEALATTNSECEHIVILLTQAWVSAPPAGEKEP